MNETIIKPLPQNRKWKLFFWFHVLIFILFSMLLLILLLAPDTVLLSEKEDVTLSFAKMKQDILEDSSLLQFVFDYILLLFLTLGLYGYIYSKKIVTEKFWIFVFVLHIISLIYQIFIFKTADYDMSNLTSVIIVSILGLLIIFFEFLALYRYGFKSPHIWNTSEKMKRNNNLKQTS